MEVQESTLPDGRRVSAEVQPGADGQPQRHGDFEVRDAEGDVKLVSGAYENGVRDGTWRFQQPTGDKIAVGKYRDGSRTGRWKFYWPDGSLSAEGIYKDGVLSGKWKLYGLEGDDAKGTVTQPAPVAGTSPLDGSQYLGFLADGRAIGWWRITRPDGSLLFQGAFDDLDHLRAADFRHAAGFEDDVFFQQRREATHPRDFAFMDPDEYGDLHLGDAVPTGSGKLSDAIAYIQSDPAWASVPAATLDGPKQPARVRPLSPGAVARDMDLRPAEEIQQSLAGAIKALAGVDWADAPSAVSAASLLQGTVLPGLGYVDMGFARNSKDISPDQQQLGILRAHSMLTFLRGTEDYWNVDARLPNIAPGEYDAFPVVRTFDPLPWLTATDEKLRQKQLGSTPKNRRGSKEEQQLAEAIDDGLAWIVGAQQPDGRWLAGDPSMDPTGSAPRHEESLGHDVGVTALCVMALCRESDTPSRPERMGAIRRGLAYILGSRRPRLGMLTTTFSHKAAKDTYSFGWIYSHAAAVQAISEARLLMDTPRLEIGLADAVGLLERARNPYGVWRYDLPPRGENDTSVTFWVIRALHAARSLGYEMDGTVTKHTLDWVQQMTDSDTLRVGYVDPGSPSARVANVNQREFPIDKGETLTAEGMVIRLLLDEETKPEVAKQASLLLACPPVWNVEEKAVDFGYWLAGTEAMVLLGGKAWDQWASDLREALVPSRWTSGAGRGSWDPVGPWCYVGGRAYATASSVLALQYLR